jgi:hypothetical protein
MLHIIRLTVFDKIYEAYEITFLSKMTHSAPVTQKCYVVIPTWAQLTTYIEVTLAFH